MDKTQAGASGREKTYGIPTVSFRIITDDESLLGPAGVNSEQARSYGFNDFSDFVQPEHYIRYIEPIETELAVQVEYDMDEQDQEWLDAVNAERRKEQSAPISYELFEIIMDKLEKEWFNLPVSHLPAEDSKCAICDDGEGENSNAIVFCDGCNLPVHQDCYGVPYIPEGQWLCRKCTVSPENPVPCLFCPNEGGAFKQTTTGHWAHLLCAIWIPELGVGNAIYMEPVEGVEMVPKNRWKLVCSLCKERVGACIQCENKSCFTAFHVTCARQMGYLMSMKLMGADGAMKAYCEKHLPAEWRDSREIEDDETNDDDEYRESEEDDDDDDAEEDGDEGQTPVPHKKGRPRKDSSTARPVATKTARAHAKSYRPGPPIVPHMIVNRLVDYVSKVPLRKRQLFVERLCRYWSLKREARRGAPLLKRLHLEPWTATSESRELTEAEKAKKLEFLVALRNDLEKVRLLAELVRKREKEKLRQAQVIKEIVDSFVLTHYVTLRATLTRVMAMDPKEYFLHPVNPAEVTDYLTVVKEPMCWLDIEAKLDRAVYLNVAEFKHDILLVLRNSMVYNASDTIFYRAAWKIKKNSQPLLLELDNITAQSATNSLLPENEGGASAEEQPPGAVGDLEASLLRLSALLAPDPGRPARDLLASIFVAETDKPKEQTPPSSGKGPRRRATHAERKAAFAEREAQYKERLSMGGGSTRRARAVAQKLGIDVEPLVSSPPPLPTPRRKISGRTPTDMSSPATDSGQRADNADAGPSSAPSTVPRKDNPPRLELPTDELEIIKKDVESPSPALSSPTPMQPSNQGQAQVAQAGEDVEMACPKPEAALVAPPDPETELTPAPDPAEREMEVVQAKQEPMDADEVPEVDPPMPSCPLAGSEAAPKASNGILIEAVPLAEEKVPKVEKQAEEGVEDPPATPEPAFAVAAAPTSPAPSVLQRLVRTDKPSSPVPLSVEELAPESPAPKEPSLQGPAPAPATPTPAPASAPPTLAPAPASELAPVPVSQEPAREAPAPQAAELPAQAPTTPARTPPPVTSSPSPAPTTPAPDSPAGSHAAPPTPTPAAPPPPQEARGRSAELSYVTTVKIEALEEDDDDEENDQASSPPGSIRPMKHRQRGVLGLQSVVVLSDKERREQERRLDLLIEQVDPQDQYKRFNVGWILPEGTKRRRPPPVTIPPVPPSKKRQSSEAASSTSYDRKGKGRASPSVSEASSSRKRRAPEPAAAAEPKRARTEMEEDELTPVPESEPPSALAPEFDLGATEWTPRGNANPGRDRARSTHSRALSEKPSETSSVVSTPRAGNVEGKPKKRPSAPPKSEADVDYPPDTHVWAKVTSYNYFPGVIVDYINNAEIVPATVLDIAEKENVGGKAWLVRFSDKQGSWAWVRADKLDKLGVDDTIDQMYLGGHERGRKSGWKSSHLRTMCKQAFQKMVDAAKKST